MKLSIQKKEILYEAHRAAQDKKEADRIKAIIHLSDGWTIEQIAAALLLDKRTIMRYKQTYLSKGLDGLLENNYQGGLYKLSEDQRIALMKELDTHLFSTAQEVCQFVWKNYKIKYTAEGMVQTLRRLGYSYKKTKAVPGKADRKEQEKFVEKYKSIKRELKGKEKIYFSDAVHPTYNMMPAYAWIKKGEERTVKTNTGRKRMNILGAYSPNDQEVIVNDEETINADSLLRLLKKIERKHPELDRIILFLDNARYNRAVKVREYLKTSKIELEYLPSYSPNLNLIERLWKRFKKKVLYNTYYEHFDEFKHAALKYFKNKSKKFKNTLKVLLSEKFHLVPE